MSASKTGRPTKYKEEYVRQAKELCYLGAIDKDLARFFEVDETTINEWKDQHPEFSQSIKEAKEEADALVVRSLFKRATGYSHPAVKIFQRNTFKKKLKPLNDELQQYVDSIKVGGDSLPKQEEVEEEAPDALVVPYTEHYPPDSVACMFWLKNRQREKWKDKQEVEHSGSVQVTPVLNFVTSPDTK